MQDIKLSEARSFSDSPSLSLEEVVQKVKKLYNHRGNHQNRKTKLSPDEYGFLAKHINNDPDFLCNILNTRARFEFSAQTQNLILKMPSLVHEYFADSVRGHFKSQIEELRQEFLQVPQITNLCDNLRLGGTLDVHSVNKKSWKSPDIHISHRLAAFPAVIIEIAHAQSRQSLSTRAKSYFRESNGDIEIVIGLKTSYNGHEATINIWRTIRNPDNTWSQARTVRNQVFRNNDNDRTAAAGTILEIPWTVFDIPGQITIPVEIGERQLSISNAVLTDRLNAAEDDKSAPILRKNKQLASDPESDPESDDIAQTISSSETLTDSSDGSYDPNR